MAATCCPHALPCRLNVDLANNFLPARPASLPRHNLAMPPPQPSLNAPGMVPLTEDYAGPGAGTVPPPPATTAAGGGGGVAPPASLPMPGLFGGGAPTLIRQEQPMLVRKLEG